MSDDGGVAALADLSTPPLCARAEFPWAVGDASTSTTPASVRCRSARGARSRRFNRRRAMPYLLPDRDLFAHPRRIAAAASPGSIGATPDEIALTVEHQLRAQRRRARAAASRPATSSLVSDREFPANVYPWLRLRETRGRGRARAHHRGGLARRGAPARAARAIRGCARSPCRWCSSATATRWISPRSPRPRGARRHLARGRRDPGHRASCRSISRETPVDMLACGGQKWLLSPWGTGLHLCAPRADRASCSPPLTGWMAFEGTDDFSRLTEYGTRSAATRAGSR